MAEVGASDYSVDAEELDVPLLIDRFRRLSEDADGFTSSTKQRTDEYRSALDEQYAHIFGDLLALRSRTAVNEGHAAIRPSSSPNGVRGRVA
jgi:hypothetical protein